MIGTVIPVAIWVGSMIWAENGVRMRQMARLKVTDKLMSDMICRGSACILRL